MLPAEKVTSILDDIKLTTRKGRAPLRHLQCLQGRLIHASYAIPNGKALLSPLVSLIAHQLPTTCKNISLDATTKQALLNWHELLKMATKQPTPCADLVPVSPDFIGYCDASKQGAGGVWFGGTRYLPPIVWQLPFPPEIQCLLVSDDNLTGTLTNSDLEMVGLLCHWLIMEQVADLAHAHVVAGCDNSPTMAWATRLLSTRSMVAAHLLRILALHMLAQQASPLTTYHWPGHLNTMADTVSHSFTSHPSASTFLSHFSSLFPLQQNDSWHLCQLPTSTCGKIYSAMLTTTSTLAWWL